MSIKHAKVNGFLVFLDEEDKLCMDLNQLSGLTGYYRGYLRRKCNEAPLSKKWAPANLPLIRLEEINRPDITSNPSQRIRTDYPDHIEWTLTNSEDIRKLIKEHTTWFYGMSMAPGTSRIPWTPRDTPFAWK